MKTTTTLLEYLSSELWNSGYSDFIDNHQIISRTKANHIKRVMRMDDQVYKIINDRLFIEFSLEDEQADKHFKRTFINRFMSREFNRQTIEDTASKVLYVCLSHEVYLNEIYNNLLDYVNGLTTSTSGNKSKTESDNRGANSELPSDNVNINVDNFIMDYANNNNISRYKSVTDGDTQSKSNKMDFDNLLKSKNLLDDIFNEFDKKCFLQIW